MFDHDLVARTWPCAASACAPTTMNSTPLALNAAMRSLKSRFTGFVRAPPQAGEREVPDGLDAFLGARIRPVVVLGAQRTAAHDPGRDLPRSRLGPHGSTIPPWARTCGCCAWIFRLRCLGARARSGPVVVEVHGVRRLVGVQARPHRELSGWYQHHVAVAASRAYGERHDPKGDDRRRRRRSAPACVHGLVPPRQDPTPDDSALHTGGTIQGTEDPPESSLGRDGRGRSSRERVRAPRVRVHPRRGTQRRARYTRRSDLRGLGPVHVAHEAGESQLPDGLDTVLGARVGPVVVAGVLADPQDTHRVSGSRDRAALSSPPAPLQPRSCSPRSPRLSRPRPSASRRPRPDGSCR